MGTLAQVTAVRSQLALGLEAYLRAAERLVLRSGSGPGLLGHRTLVDKTDESGRVVECGVYVWPDVIARHTLDSTTLARRRAADERGEFGPDDEVLTRTPWLELLRSESARRVVVLGRPGQGKTTLAQLTCREVAREGLAALSARNGVIEDVPIPILLRVADVVHAGSIEAAVAAAVTRSVSEAIELFADGSCRPAAAKIVAFVLRQLASPRTLLCLDALDEGGDGPDDRDVDPRVALRDLNQLQNCRVIVTGRTHSYDALSPIVQEWDAHEYELAALTPAQKRRFVERWFLPRASAVDRVLDLALGRGQIAELAGNPLLLTLMCATADVQDTEIGTRIDLLEAAVRHCVRRPHSKVPLGDGGATDERLHVLAGAVWTLCESNPAARRFSFDAWTRALATAARQIVHDDRAVAFATTLRWDIVQAGLLINPSRGVYAFLHPVFQQFLLARSLSARDPADIARTIGAQAAHEAWREAILLTIGVLAREATDNTDALSKAVSVVEAFVGAVVDDASGRALALVAEGIAEGRGSLLARIPCDQVRRRLAETMSDDVHMGATVRMAAGNALGKLGDPRFRSDVFHLPNDEWLGFVAIPLGPFRMGSDAVWALDDERPVHEVALRCFFIARFPVTVAQFEAFVENEHASPVDARWRQRASNHPVVYVSWEDAVSYCRWLTRRLRASTLVPPALRATLVERDAGARWVVELPTEAQWERAARGLDARRFPWGQDHEPVRSNCSGAGLGATGPVGCFPSGRSACGAEDLCGNVWEWTRSEERRYPYDAADGRDDVRRAGHRVLRGGAFNHRLAHAGYRSSGTQVFRNGAVGFRVVLDRVAVDQ